MFTNTSEDDFYVIYAVAYRQGIWWLVADQTMQSGQT